jgi:multiple sugar transport system substrate-binding protein
VTKANVALKGVTWDHVRGYGPLHASMRPYFEERGVQVSWDKRTLKDFGDASLQELAQLYDLIIIDHPHAGTAATTHSVIPLDEFLNTEILNDAFTHSVGPSYKSYWYEGHLWALPIDAACQVACYRKDLFEPLHLPQTWDDVFRLAEDLKTRKQFIGMALCPTDCNCSFLTLCAQLKDPFEETKFPSENTVTNALGILQKLHTLCHPESTKWNPIRLYDYMTSENNIAYCPLAFGYTNYARPGHAKNELSFGSIPGKTSALLGGAGIAVSKYCKHISEATHYAAWLCSEEFQCSTYVDAAGQPAHKKAWLNEHANKITGHFFSNTLPTIEAAYVRPRNNKWPLFQEKLGEIIFTFLVEQKTIEQTWKAINRCYREIFLD